MVRLLSVAGIVAGIVVGTPWLAAESSADLVLTGPSYKIHRAGSGSAFQVTVTNKGPAAVNTGGLAFDLSQLDGRLTPINAQDTDTGTQCEPGGRTFQCRLGNLAGGDSQRFTLLVDNAAGLQRGPAGWLSINVSGGPGDPNLGNNVLRVPWEVSLAQDGRLRIDITRASGRVGDLVTLRVTAQAFGPDPYRFWGVGVIPDALKGIAALGGPHCTLTELGSYECLRKEGIRVGETQSMTLRFKILSVDTWTQGAIGVRVDFWGWSGPPEGTMANQPCLILVVGESRCAGGTVGGGAPVGRQAAPTPAAGPPLPVAATPSNLSATSAAPVAAQRPAEATAGEPPAIGPRLSLDLADRVGTALVAFAVAIFAALRMRHRITTTGRDRFG